MQNIRNDIIEKVARVRHDNQRLFPLLQIVLKPQHGMQVKVVCRLVEQQHVWRDKERQSERDAHAPPAGKLFCRPLLIFVGEAEAAQDRRRARHRRARVDFFEASVDRVEARAGFVGRLEAVFLALGVGGHDGALFLEKGLALNVAVQDSLQN